MKKLFERLVKRLHYRLPVIAVSLLLITQFSCALTDLPSSNTSNKHQPVTLEIVRKLDNRHFVDRDIDDGLSAQFLENYLDRLDPNKSFFYQPDIESFEQYRTQLDDLLKRGDNSPGFLIYKRFKQRLEERLEAVIKVLKDEEVHLISIKMKLSMQKISVMTGYYHQKKAMNFGASALSHSYSVRSFLGSL